LVNKAIAIKEDEISLKKKEIIDLSISKVRISSSKNCRESSDLLINMAISRYTVRFDGLSTKA
jgi:hypothetical protein